MVISPDSLRIFWDSANKPHNPASTSRFFNSKERKFACLKTRLMTQPPTPPITAPTPKRSNKPMAALIGPASLFKIVSRTTTARIAPTGSIKTPSPSSIAATCRSTFICLSNGVTTVGPVTTTREAYRKAIGQGNSLSQCAAILPPSSVTRVPKVTSNCKVVETLPNSRRSKSNPPSNKIIAVARATITSKPVPSI